VGDVEAVTEAVTEALIELASPDETFALGVRIAALLQPGDFLGLTGDLGTGKTLLIRGLAKGLGVPDAQVQSPTFTIVNTYAGGRLPLHHADLYRIESQDELYATGYFDLLEGEGAMAVEWVERIPGALPQGRLQLRLERSSDTARKLSLEAAGPRHEALLRQALAT
jgi:tRNA threonylcarbamoyladenosine biosynthesis protein TsaE